MASTTTKNKTARMGVLGHKKHGGDKQHRTHRAGLRGTSTTPMARPHEGRTRESRYLTKSPMAWSVASTTIDWHRIDEHIQRPRRCPSRRPTTKSAPSRSMDLIQRFSASPRQGEIAGIGGSVSSSTEAHATHRSWRPSSSRRPRRNEVVIDCSASHLYLPRPDVPNRQRRKRHRHRSDADRGRQHLAD